MTDDRMVRLEGQIDDWQSQGVRWVRWELPDFHGTARAKLVPIGACRGYLERGLNMYGGVAVLDSRSDVVGGTVYNEETLYADQMLHPDPDSAALVPWRPDTARWICSARWANGSELEASPRQLLGRVLAVAGEMGYGIRTGAEYEFYVLDAGKQPLFGGYHIFNPNRNSYHPVIDDILEKVQLAGIDLITASAEYGPSQFEVNFGPGDGLAGPDRSYTFKNAVKEICQQHGLHGTFMSKPITGSAGCGAHFHISLLDLRTGESVMGDDGDEHGITDTCRYFIGGNLRHAKAVYSLLSPTINCYRRRRPHLFAPDQHLLGIAGSLGAGSRHGRIGALPSYRAAGALRALQPLPRRRRRARGRAPRHPRSGRPGSPVVRCAGGGQSGLRATPGRSARGAGLTSRAPLPSATFSATISSPPGAACDATSCSASTITSATGNATSTSRSTRTWRRRR